VVLDKYWTIYGSSLWTWLALFKEDVSLVRNLRQWAAATVSWVGSRRHLNYSWTTIDTGTHTLVLGEPDSEHVIQNAHILDNDFPWIQIFQDSFIPIHTDIYPFFWEFWVSRNKDLLNPVYKANDWTSWDFFSRRNIMILFITFLSQQKGPGKSSFAYIADLSISFTYSLWKIISNKKRILGWGVQHHASKSKVQSSNSSTTRTKKEFCVYTM
jgi:hypothetical protein